MKLYRLSKDISKMDIGEVDCIKITDDKFLYVENWYDEKGNWFTTLELNNGEEVDGKYDLEEVIEVVTLDYGDKKAIKEGLKFMLSCCKKRYSFGFSMFKY